MNSRSRSETSEIYDHPVNLLIEFMNQFRQAVAGFASLWLRLYGAEHGVDQPLAGAVSRRVLGAWAVSGLSADFFVGGMLGGWRLAVRGTRGIAVALGAS